MTDREKIKRAFAPLRASDTVVREVLDMAEHKNTHTIKKSGRILALVAAVTVLLIGTALAAGVFGLSDGIRKHLHIPEEEAASLAEGSSMVSSPRVSDTRDGVTISVEQSVADSGSALIALRVEGLEVPEGRSPVWGEAQLTLDGERAANWSFGPYEDMTWDGEKFVYSDGTAAELTAEGIPIPRFLRADGSMEFDISIAPGQGEKKSLVGREIQLTITRLGTEPVTDKITPEEGWDYTAEGPWVLAWTLEGSESRRSWTPDAPLGDTGAVVTEVTLTPLSVHVAYDYPLRTVPEIGYDQDGNAFETQTIVDPPMLTGFILRDGTAYTGILDGGTMGYEDARGEVYTIDMGLTRVIDPDQVAALVFHETVNGDVPAPERTEYTVSLDE